MARSGFLDRPPAERGQVYELDSAARLSGLESMDPGSELRIDRYGLKNRDGGPVGVVAIVAGEPVGVGDLAGFDPTIVRIYDASDNPVQARFTDRQGDYSLNFFAVTNGVETVVEVVDGEPVEHEREVLQFTPLVPGVLHPVTVRGVGVAEYGIDDQYNLVVRHNNAAGMDHVEVYAIGMEDGYTRKMPIENISWFSQRSVREILDNLGPGSLPSISMESVEIIGNSVRLRTRKDVVVNGDDFKEVYRYTTYSVLDIPSARRGYYQDLVNLLEIRSMAQDNPDVVREDIGRKVGRVLAWMMGFSRRLQRH